MPVRSADEGVDHRLELRLRLRPLVVGDGARDDSRASMQGCVRTVDGRPAERDRPLAISTRVHPPDRSRVAVTWVLLDAAIAASPGHTRGVPRLPASDRAPARDRDDVWRRYVQGPAHRGHEVRDRGEPRDLGRSPDLEARCTAGRGSRRWRRPRGGARARPLREPRRRASAASSVRIEVPAIGRDSTRVPSRRTRKLGARADHPVARIHEAPGCCSQSR